MYLELLKWIEQLPLLDKPNSSWGTLNCYSYWFNLREGKFYGVFELGGWNIPNDEKQTMIKIIDMLKPEDKRKDDFRYKRVYRTKWYDLNDVDDLEAEAEKAVRSAVTEIKNMEKKVIGVINK